LHEGNTSGISRRRCLKGRIAMRAEEKRAIGVPSREGSFVGSLQGFANTAFKKKAGISSRKGPPRREKPAGSSPKEEGDFGLTGGSLGRQNLEAARMGFLVSDRETKKKGLASRCAQKRKGGMVNFHE